MTVILNKTPWSTEDLEKALLPMVTGCGLVEITVELISPHKSRWRKKDRFSRIKLGGGEARDKVTIELISAKRAAAREETLDRLSLTSDLKTTETSLPRSVIVHLTHGFTKMRETRTHVGRSHIARDSYEVRRTWSSIESCLEDWCECPRPDLAEIPLVRGDKKARTHASPNAVTVEALIEKRRHWEKHQKRAIDEAASLRAAAVRAEAKGEEYQEKINKIDERIIKVKAKAAMSVPLGSQDPEELDEREGGDGDEDQQEDE